MSCIFLLASLTMAQDLSRIYHEYALRHRNPYWHGFKGIPYDRDGGRLYHLRDANWPHYYGYG